MNASAQFDALGGLIAYGDANIECVADVTSGSSCVLAGVGFVTVVTNVQCAGQNGRNWTPIPTSTDVWSVSAIDANTWTPEQSSINNWTESAANSNTWTVESQGTNVWQRQG